MIHRRELCTLDNNTTNRIERYIIPGMILSRAAILFRPIYFISRYHCTIKKVLKSKGKKLNMVIEGLLSIITMRLIDRERKTIESTIKFPTITFSPLLESIRARLTEPAWARVLKQSKKSTTSYSFIQVQFYLQKRRSWINYFPLFCCQDSSNGHHSVTTKSGTFHIKEDLSGCSCYFSKASLLPCSHILFAAEELDQEPPTESRWNRHVI